MLQEWAEQSQENDAATHHKSLLIEESADALHDVDDGGGKGSGWKHKNGNSTKGSGSAKGGDGGSGGSDGAGSGGGHSDRNVPKEKATTNIAAEVTFVHMRYTHMHRHWVLI